MLHYNSLSSMLYLFFLFLQFHNTDSILSPTSSSSSSSTNPKVILSCQGASSTDNSNSFCSLVNWQHAAAYASSNYSTYNSAKPFSSEQQGDYARTLFDLYHSYGNKVANSACDDAMTRLACVSAFPPCPDIITSPASGFTYFVPCRTQCEVVKSVCQSSIDCSRMPQKNCALSLPSANYALSIDQGPYTGEAVLYPIIFVSWCILGIVWVYYAFIKYRFNSVLLCKFLALIPFIKIVSLIFGLSFWETCVKQSMCTAWLSIAYQNIVLIFETALLFGYWLIAKGWTITRDSLAMEDWRLLIIAIALFYMFSSILEVLYSTILNNTGYWILVTLLYASMYGAIFYHLQYELFKVHFHVSFLRPTMASNITGPLREKYFMFQCFLGLVASSFILEIICQVMVAKGVQYYSVLSLYEVISLIIITSIGWLFRPRELSPFFFMIPARPTDARSRPVAVVEVDEYDESNESLLKAYSSTSGARSFDVELGPLMSNAEDNSGNVFRAKSRLIVVKGPDDGMTMGISTYTPI